MTCSLSDMFEQINRLELLRANPSSFCIVWLLGLIVPNFSSRCHNPLTFNCSAVTISGTKCPNADNRVTLFLFQSKA